MTVDIGDKTVLIPVSGGGYAVVKSGSIEEGDQVAVIPTAGGGKSVVKIASPEIGDKVVLCPIDGGGYVCLISDGYEEPPGPVYSCDYYYNRYGPFSVGGSLPTVATKTSRCAFSDICKIWIQLTARWWTREELQAILDGTGYLYYYSYDLTDPDIMYHVKITFSLKWYDYYGVWGLHMYVPRWQTASSSGPAYPDGTETHYGCAYYYVAGTYSWCGLDPDIIYIWNLV